MGANQSNLSNTGYDYVVAVTQDSINASLEQYLYQGLPEVTLCYTYDANNNPVATDFATLVANAGNTNPFDVPDGTASSDPRVQNLNNAAFAFAIKARLGVPPKVKNLPPILALNPGQSNVTYTLMFAEFMATELVFGPRESITWVNQSQPSGTSWTFSGAVDLNFQDTSFTTLPSGVQARLKDPGDFSVQQLYYDLNSSDLEQGFQFSNVPSNSALNTFMTADFIDTYWKHLGTGAEVLGYGAQQVAGNPGPLAVTDVNFFTPDAVGGNGAPLTLNYLCAANGDPLPDTTHAGFGWNWVDAGEVSQYDGVAALNRNTLARYLDGVAPPGCDSLASYVPQNCFTPWVKVTYEGGIEIEVDYSWNMTGGQAPTVTYPATGSTILSYSYQSPTAEDDAGLDGSAGEMKLSSSFNLDVSVEGNQLVIVQHLVVWTYTRYLATSASGNIVDKQITDTYTIGVDDHGQLAVSLQSSVPVDHSETPGANGFLNFWADVNSLASDVKTWAQNFAATSLHDIPVSLVQDFVFPGGGTFSFLDAKFSDNQDLVSHITYADVS